MRYQVLAGAAVLATLAGCSSQTHATATAPTRQASAHAATAVPSRASAPPKPSPTALSTAQIGAMVRELYYGETEAYLNSQHDGLTYALAHDYPGSVNSAKYLACAAQDEAQFPGETVSMIPEMDTMAPDPAWVGPVQNGVADWAFAGKKPHGQTFILTVDQTDTSPSQQPSTTKAQVHVTVWNGKAYFYLTACA